MPRAEGKCLIDYSFHLIVSDPNEQTLGQDLPALVKDGYTSFKVFMTYDDLKLNDREMLEVFDVARRESALVMVHAENYDAIRFMTERLERAGHTEPYFHGTSRPAPVEREATHRAITFAELVDVPIMIVHVSSGDAVEQIRWAQSRGLKIYGETCPQYLVADRRGPARPQHGRRQIRLQPAAARSREPASLLERPDQRHLLDILVRPLPVPVRRPAGKKRKGDRTAFRWVPNGIPGVETRLPILFSEGVVKGRIDLQQFVALTSTNHARMYGLAGRKGTISVGADADIAIWDPELTRRSGRRTCTTAPTTRPMKAWKSPAGRPPSSCAAESSSKTAPSPANPATAPSSNATSRPSPNRAARPGCPPETCGAIAHPRRSIRSRGLTGHTPFGSHDNK